MYSIKYIKIYPPSSAGIGNKFINPRLIDNKAIKKRKLGNPREIASPEIFAIPIGPAISSLSILKLINFTNPFIHSKVKTNVSLNP